MSTLKKIKSRTYLRYTKEALTLLGHLIKAERKTRKITETEISERVGISRSTLQKIEQGDPSVEIGIFFEAAHIAGVKLFDVENNFSAFIENTDNKLSLLPKKIRKSQKKTLDDF